MTGFIIFISFKYKKSYNTDKYKLFVRGQVMKLFKSKKGIIIKYSSANLADFIKLIKNSDTNSLVEGYVFTAQMFLKSSLEKIMTEVKKNTGKAVIFDGQILDFDSPLGPANTIGKIPKTGKIDAIVTRPFGGIKVLENIAKYCSDNGIAPVISSYSGQEGFYKSMGGYIEESTPAKMFLDAATFGINHFLVPFSEIGKLKIYCHRIINVIGAPNILFSNISNDDFKKIPEICSEEKDYNIYAIINENQASPEEIAGFQIQT